jgi:hypothetical protein
MARRWQDFWSAFFILSSSSTSMMVYKSFCCLEALFCSHTIHLLHKQGVSIFFCLQVLFGSQCLSRQSVLDLHLNLILAFKQTFHMLSTYVDGIVTYNQCTIFPPENRNSLMICSFTVNPMQCQYAVPQYTTFEIVELLLTLSFLQILKLRSRRTLCNFLNRIHKFPMVELQLQLWLLAIFGPTQKSLKVHCLIEWEVVCMMVPYSETISIEWFHLCSEDGPLCNVF